MYLGCLFGHNWEYKVEDITYVRLNNYVDITTSSVNDRVVMQTKVRLCVKCYKKQRTHGQDWTSCELTLQEDRDKKLKEIGI